MPCRLLVCLRKKKMSDGFYMLPMVMGAQKGQMVGFDLPIPKGHKSLRTIVADAVGGLPRELFLLSLTVDPKPWCGDVLCNPLKVPNLQYIRRELLTNARVLEVGFNAGVSAALLYGDGDGSVVEIHAVDDCRIPYVERCFEHLKHNMALRERAELHKGNSVDVLPRLEDRSFDFIHVDASHHADFPLRDLREAMRLVRDGGYILMDDYADDGAVFPDVKRAVDELLRDNPNFHRVELPHDPTMAAGGAFHVLFRYIA